MLSLLLNGEFGLDVPAAPRIPVLWDKALYTLLWHSLGILLEGPRMCKREYGSCGWGEGMTCGLEDHDFSSRGP